jgi:hypothetical protein
MPHISFLSHDSASGWVLSKAIGPFLLLLAIASIVVSR